MSDAQLEQGAHTCVSEPLDPPSENTRACFPTTGPSPAIRATSGGSSDPSWPSQLDEHRADDHVPAAKRNLEPAPSRYRIVAEAVAFPEMIRSRKHSCGQYLSGVRSGSPFIVEGGSDCEACGPEPRNPLRRADACDRAGRGQRLKVVEASPIFSRPRPTDRSEELGRIRLVNITLSPTHRSAIAWADRTV